MTIPTFRKGRALLGFMTEQDALNFLKGVCVVEDENELQAYHAKWASVSNYVKALQPRSLSSLARTEISVENSNYIQDLVEQDLFKQMFHINYAIREVEIERVVVFQRYIDTEYAGQLASKMKDNENFVLEACLPLEFRQALEVSFDEAVAGVTFSSLSPKLVLAGMHVVGPGGVDITVGGRPVQQPGVLFLIGTQVNYVQISQYDGRYFLKNGYHRAYAALLSGRTRIPAIVSDVQDFGEVGAMNPAFFPRELLMSEAPPVLQDFLNDEVAIDVKMRPLRRVIRIRVDDFSLPR